MCSTLASGDSALTGVEVGDECFNFRDLWTGVASGSSFFAASGEERTRSGVGGDAFETARRAAVRLVIVDINKMGTTYEE